MTKPPYLDPHLGLVGAAGLRPTALASVDTNFILDQAAARLGAQIPVVRTMRIGSIRHFAPMRVANEVAWTYEAAARHRRVNADSLLRVLNEDLMPCIRFVDMPPVDLPRDKRLVLLNEVDEDDLDVGYLGLLLSPSHVFSHDKHLRMSGFAPPTIEDLNTVLSAGLAVEISDGSLVATGFAVRAGAAGARNVANAVAVRLEVPLWVVGLIVALVIAGGTASALSSPDRRQKAGRALIAVSGEVAKLAERRTVAEELLDRTSLKAPNLSAESRIFRTVALADHALLASEVQAALTSTGDAPTESWIREFLRSHPSFVEVNRYRWKLGRQLSIVSGPD